MEPLMEFLIGLVMILLLSLDSVLQKYREFSRFMQDLSCFINIMVNCNRFVVRRWEIPPQSPSGQLHSGLFLS